MGHAHLASGPPDEPVPVGRRARVVLLVCLALAALGTVIGLVTLWPDHDPRPRDSAAAFAAPGVTFPHARVTRVEPPCPQQANGETSGSEGSASRCGRIGVEVDRGRLEGTRATVQVAPEVSRSRLRAGDHVQLLRTPASEGLPAALTFFSVDRTTPLAVLAALFVIVVVAVARLRGVLALLGLGFGAFVVVRFMLPALLTGAPGLAVALVGSSSIMFVVLYLAHGVSLRTSTALAGTLVGIVIMAFTGVIAVQGSRLSGIADESGAILSTFAGQVTPSGLLSAAIIVAGLGVLNDVTITQASAVWELRNAAPHLSRRALFSSAMRIGRDHIASTIYTIVFAYAGTALSVLLLLFIYDRPLLQLVSTEDIAEEVTRTLTSGIGLVLAVPATTAIAVALVAARAPRDRRSVL